MAINSDSIRRESLALWSEYFRDAHRDSVYDEEFRCFIDKLRMQAEESSASALQPWLHILEDSIQWLANIWGILSRKIQSSGDNDKLLLSIWSLVSSSCNYAISARLLVISGFDNSARSIVRALDECLCVCITILYRPELAVGFQSSQSHEETSKFWYENFNTKRLRKHLNAVEADLGVEAHISREFREYRDHELSYFSQTIHPSYLAGVMAAHVFDENTGDAALGLFGKLSPASERTLSHACKTIWYFSRFGFLLLFNEVNGQKPLVVVDKDDEMHQMVIVGREVLSKLNLRYWQHQTFS